MSDIVTDTSQRERDLERLVGRTVAGKYRVERVIGRGGMGAVFEAEHLTIGRKVAIKFVHRHFASDHRVAGRFEREARAASAIESEHIVSVFDAGVDEGRPYIVMELLRGEDVGRRLRRCRTLPVSESLHIVAQILRGLARAHAAGIVHRDLKPDNVFLVDRDDGQCVKIVDFGISKIQPLSAKTPFAITQKGVVLGTPLFMSPEQAEALPDIDARSDLYSVGAILFECLTGRPPHVGETSEAVIFSICTTGAPDVREFAPSVPPGVAAFVAKALTKSREGRFQTASEMLAAVREVAPSELAAAPLPGLDGDSTLKDDAPPSALLAAMTPVGKGHTVRLGSNPAPQDVRQSSPGSTSPAGTDVSWSTGGSRRAAGRKALAPHVRMILVAFAATLAGVGATVWIATSLPATAPRATDTAAAAPATSSIAVPAPSPASTGRAVPPSSASASPVPPPTPVLTAAPRPAPKKAKVPEKNALDIARDIQ